MAGRNKSAFNATQDAVREALEPEFETIFADKTKLELSEFVGAIARTLDIPFENVTQTIAGVRVIVAEAMHRGVDVDLGKNFGKFVTIMVKERAIRVPATGELKQHPARRKMRFAPSKDLKTFAGIDD